MNKTIYTYQHNSEGKTPSLTTSVKVKRCDKESRCDTITFKYHYEASMYNTDKLSTSIRIYSSHYKTLEKLALQKFNCTVSSMLDGIAMGCLVVLDQVDTNVINDLLPKLLAKVPKAKRIATDERKAIGIRLCVDTLPRLKTIAESRHCKSPAAMLESIAEGTFAIAHIETAQLLEQMR